MNLTPQQLAFLLTTSAPGSVALRARAGSGKTFSLRQWAQQSHKTGIATSFSKSTVVELAEKIGPSFPAKTQHALCLAALKSNGRNPKLATSFSKSTVVELAEKIGPSFPAKTQHALCLAALKSNGRNPKLDTSKMFNIVKRLAEDNDIPFELQGEIRSLATFAKTVRNPPRPRRTSRHNPQRA